MFTTLTVASVSQRCLGRSRCESARRSYAFKSMQSLGEINRPVLSASVADCNRNVASVDLTEVIEHLLDKSAQLVIERRHLITFKELLHQRIQTRHASYVSLPVGVWRARASKTKSASVGTPRLKAKDSISMDRPSRRLAILVVMRSRKAFGVKSVVSTIDRPSRR